MKEKIKFRRTAVIALLASLALLPALSITPVAHAANQANVVARISGGGEALMAPPGVAVGVSSFGTGITLLSDGTATGHFDCVDHQGDPTGEDNIFGTAVNWWVDSNGFINVNFVGKLTTHGGQPVDVTFTIAFQAFGGAGVGHWSLTAFDTLFCWETVTSGQVVYEAA